MVKIPITIRYATGKDAVTEVSGTLVWHSNAIMGDTLMIRSGDKYIGIHPSRIIDYEIPFDEMPSSFITNPDDVVNSTKAERSARLEAKKMAKEQEEIARQQYEQAKKEQIAALKDGAKELKEGEKKSRQRSTKKPAEEADL